MPRLAAPPRVVVTGAGIITALGLGWKPNSAGFRAGRNAFRPVTLFDVSCHRVKSAAETKLPAGLPRTRLSKRQLARLDRANVLLLWAADEAWRQSGWEPAENLPLILGTTSGGMLLGEAYFRQAVQTPLRHRHQPTRAFHYQAQTQGRMVMDALGLEGPVTIVSDACASGGSAITLAWERLRRGDTERVLVGGYDAISQLVFSGFDALQALSPTACRPFDARRDGLAIGEGAAMLALETLDHARRRKASILCELAGCATTMDLHHLTQPHPEGRAALAAMKRACDRAGVSAEDVGYLNAHGTGTVLNDQAEAWAINEWAGTRTTTLPVSSTKAGIGHSLGAAGVVEAVVCLMVLREQWLPPQLDFETPDPVCRFPIVHQPCDARVDAALSNSFGFGGVNASLVFRRWP